jgi:hypothetical protein
MTVKKEKKFTSAEQVFRTYFPSLAREGENPCESEEHVQTEHDLAQKMAERFREEFRRQTAKRG